MDDSAYGMIGEGEMDELTNRAIGRWFHLIWEVWVIVANSAALVVSLTVSSACRWAGFFAG